MWESLEGLVRARAQEMIQQVSTFRGRLHAIGWWRANPLVLCVWVGAWNVRRLTIGNLREGSDA